MFLGLDLGTSGLKAVLIDDAQAVVAEATAPLSVSRPHPAWSEQDPADWVAAAEAAMAALASKHPLGKVAGIGLSGQQHGAVMLDRAHQVVRPAILWNDTRASEEARALDGTQVVRNLTGNVIFAGFTAPKLVWAAKHEPDAYERTALVLLPKDYLRLWLTGEAVSEPSDASGTGWFEIGARNWSDDLLAAGGMRASQMPAIVEGSHVSGTLRGELAERWGIPSGTPVAGGGGDNAAAAVGMGIVRPGPASLSLGTSGVLFATTPGFAPAPETSVHAFCHALPELWHQMGVMLSATDCLNWYCALVGESPATLVEALGPLQAPGRTLFMPYLGGERTPINDPAIRAALIGVSHATDRAAGARAVLEGVTFAVRDNRDALAATGTEVADVIAVGGGSRSRHWMEMVATALGVPVLLPAGAELGAAFGAARLGLMAATGAGEEVATPPQIAATIEPNRALAAAFDEAHARYKATYEALRGLS